MGWMNYIHHSTLGGITNGVYSVWQFFMEPVINLFPLHWQSVSGQLNYDLFHWGLTIETTALAKAGLSFEGDLQWQDVLSGWIKKIKCLYIERHIVWLIWSRLLKLFFKFESCTWLSVIMYFYGLCTNRNFLFSTTFVCLESLVYRKTVTWNY